MPSRALATAALLASGCSLIVEFDPEGRPCSPEKRCLDGYSCMAHNCVRDHSVPEGQTCSLSINCEAELACSVHDFVCHKRCDRAYGNHAECAASQLCATIETPEGTSVAACTAIQCDPNQVGACAAERATQICVRVTSGGLCEEQCSINCAIGDCTGTCPPVEPYQSCQPLGPDDTFACVREGTGVQGDCCNQIDRRCDRYHACVRSDTGDDGVCLKYCDGNEDCGALTCNVHGALPNQFQACGAVPLPTPSCAPASALPPPAGKLCSERCADWTNCADGYNCVGGECVASTPACVDDNGCWETNTFSIPCSTDAGCSSVGGACVAIQGGGACAVRNAGDCSLSGMYPLIMSRVEGGTADVCVSFPPGSFRCLGDGSCGCSTNNACRSSTTQPICDANLGLCICESDAQCQNGGANQNRCYNGLCGCGSDTECPSRYPICNTTTGLCGCGSNADCRTGYPGSSYTCGADGGCYCSSAADCTDSTTHPGTTWQCQ